MVFGLVHFFSGLLARRASSYAVAVSGQVGGTIAVAVGSLVVPSPEVTAAALGWGALSGVGTGIGVTFLYRGLSKGNMSVVVPLSDVGSVTVPVVVGVVLLGDRPSASAWAGVLVACPALWLVSRTRQTRNRATATGTVDGLLAGVGFALQFIAVSRVDLAAGLWPILAARVLAVATIVPLALPGRASLRLPRRLLLPACAVGSAGSLAIVLYVLSTQAQLLTLATVLAALYPAIPVLLAMTFLHEKVTRRQTVGLVFTATAITCISLG